MRTGLGSRFSCKRGFLAEAWLFYRWERVCYTSFVILAGLGIALVFERWFGWVWEGCIGRFATVTSVDGKAIVRQ